MNHDYQTDSQRNYCLFLFEIIASIFVVSIHIKFPGFFGRLMENTGRFAVPLFFVIAGFFLYKPGISEIEFRAKLKRRIKRLAILLLISGTLYLICGVVGHFFNLGYSFSEINTFRIIAFFLLNNPLVSQHNWFLMALINAYGFMYLFPKVFIGKDKWIIPIISVLSLVLIGHIVAYQFNWGVETIPYCIFRNWLLSAIPFISLGILLKRKEEALRALKLKYVITCLSLTFLLMIGELFLYQELLHASPEFGVFNVLFVVLIICLGVQMPNLGKRIKLTHVQGNWTKYVYILHMFISFLIIGLFMLLKINENTVAQYFLPVIVVLVSFIIALLINYCVIKIKNRKTNTN